jgi:HTH-type transcriptional regulator / antitoxin HigA
MSTATVLANPARMIEKGAPRLIHNDEELEAYTEALFNLTVLDKPSPAEVEAIELLTLLIERYEDEHYAIPEADPVSVVRYLMEKGNLKQRDLIPEFGSESAVSMFLSGQRNLTLDQITRLCARFKLTPDVLIPRVPGLAELEHSADWQATAQTKDGHRAFIMREKDFYVIFDGGKQIGTEPFTMSAIAKKFSSGEYKLLRGSIPDKKNRFKTKHSEAR